MAACDHLPVNLGQWSPAARHMDICHSCGVEQGMQYSCCYYFACRYGFVVYGDPGVTDIACAGLNGLKMGDRTLTVRRATEVGGCDKLFKQWSCWC